jgi:DNA-directed RNA polymerase subunit M/transcription elongation factor TFIIS
MSDTGGNDIEKHNQPQLSNFKCPRCKDNLYYDTNHILLAGDYERSCTCWKCDNRYILSVKSEKKDKTFSGK